MTPLPATKIQTGIGYSQKENSYEAGVEIANETLKGTALKEETLFLLFATATHKIDMLISGIKSVIGDKPKVFGCTTTGVVTRDFISYTNTLAGGAFLSADTPFFDLFLEIGIKDREFEAGKSLAKKISDNNSYEDASMLMFYDSVKQTSTEGQPRLNIATPILEGFYSQFKHWPTIAGIGAFGDINFTLPCCVWADGKIERHGLTATTIYGALKMDTIIMHGTRPVGGYHTITKAEGNVIFEIDNKPALDIIDMILGGTMPWEEFPLLVTLGVNNGDKYSDFKEEDYASRLCLAIDKERKALIMFETDLTDGTEVQLMRRNIDFKYIQPQVDKLIKKSGSRKPVLAFYIDCLGRVSSYSGISEEESLEVIKALGEIPFFGIFSGVEIANVGPAVKALDWTGVLCLFSEE